MKVQKKIDISKTNVETIQATKNCLNGKTTKKTGRKIMILKKKIYADSLDSVSLEFSDAKVDMKEMKKEIDDMITVDDEAKVAYDE